jgi:hypothetical protein
MRRKTMEECDIVYVLVHGYDCEAESIMGVFSDEALAKVHMNKLINHEISDDEYYEIYEFVLDEFVV